MHDGLMDSLSLTRLVPWDDILWNIFCWRQDQPEILRNPNWPRTMSDMDQYKLDLLTDDCRRFSNKVRMWPITNFHGTMLAWAGLTHMTRDTQFRSTAELSFLTSPKIVSNPDEYSTLLVYFLQTITPLFFSNKYWQGYRLWSETYAIPGRELHIEIMDRHMKREGVMRHHHYRDGKYSDIIYHGLLKSDWEQGL
jgi:hypothetical protein